MGGALLPSPSLTVTVREVDEAAGAPLAVFTAEVHLTETSTGEVLTGTVCELGIALTTCGRTHTHTHAQSRYTLLSCIPNHCGICRLSPT